MDEDVLFIYEWFVKTMAAVGWPISRPHCSDIQKTYQYRFIDRFVHKARQYGLDKTQMQVLVKEIVKYAKDHKILYRGAAIFSAKNDTQNI